MLKQYVGIEEAAAYLGVKKSWLYENVRLGRVPSYKVGSMRRFKLTELEEWLLGRREGPTQGGDGQREDH